MRTQPPSPPQAGPADLRDDASARPEGCGTELGINDNVGAVPRSNFTDFFPFFSLPLKTQGGKLKACAGHRGMASYHLRPLRGKGAARASPAPSPPSSLLPSPHILMSFKCHLLYMRRVWGHESTSNQNHYPPPRAQVLMHHDTSPASATYLSAGEGLSGGLRRAKGCEVNSVGRAAAAVAALSLSGFFSHGPNQQERTGPGLSWPVPPTPGTRLFCFISLYKLAEV